MRRVDEPVQWTLVNAYIHIRIQYIQAVFNKYASLWKQWTHRKTRVYTFGYNKNVYQVEKMYKIIISKQDIELGYCVSNLSARSYIHIRNTYRIITKKANISLMRCRGHSHTFSFRCINITFDIVYGFVDFVLFSWCYVYTWVCHLHTKFFLILFILCASI